MAELSAYFLEEVRPLNGGRFLSRRPMFMVLMLQLREYFFLEG